MKIIDLTGHFTAARQSRGLPDPPDPHLTRSFLRQVVEAADAFLQDPLDDFSREDLILILEQAEKHLGDR